MYRKKLCIKVKMTWGLKQGPMAKVKDDVEKRIEELINRHRAMWAWAMRHQGNEQVPAPAREDRQLLPPAVLFDNPYQQLPAALFDIPSERARPPALKVILYFK